MTDKSIDNYSNLYLNGAQGAYAGRYDNLSFPYLLERDKYIVDYGSPTDNKGNHPDYTQALADTGKTIYGKDASGNPITVSSDGKLYLQPDNVFMSDSLLCQRDKEQA